MCKEQLVVIRDERGKRGKADAAFMFVHEGQSARARRRAETQSREKKASKRNLLSKEFAKGHRRAESQQGGKQPHEKKSFVCRIETQKKRKKRRREDKKVKPLATLRQENVKQTTTYLDGEVLAAAEGGVGLEDHDIASAGHVLGVQVLHVHADVVAGAGRLDLLVVHLDREHLGTRVCDVCVWREWFIFCLVGIHDGGHPTSTR